MFEGSLEEHLRDAADAVGTDLGGTLVLNHRGTWPPSFRLAHFTSNFFGGKIYQLAGPLYLNLHFLFALLVQGLPIFGVTFSHTGCDGVFF